MQITELTNPFDGAFTAKIHTQGCAGITKDIRAGWSDKMDLDMTGQEWAEDTFGEPAADHNEWGTDEWMEDVKIGAMDVTVCGCAKKAGFKLP